MDTSSIPETSLKRCSKCKQFYPPTSEYFQSDKSRRVGLCYICKACSALKTSKYQAEHKQERSEYGKNWYNNNRARHLATSKAHYYATLPYQHERKRLYYSEHREQYALKAKAYVDNNPEKLRLRRMRYFAAHPEKRRQYNQQRRARLKAADGRHTANDIKVQYLSQKGLCWWCGKPVEDNYHVDHRIPLDKGGSNDAANICITCPPCNLSKGNKMPFEWSGRLL